MSAPKLGAKGYCRECGFAIEVVSMSNNSFFPRYFNTWVHIRANGRYEQHCFWVANPKRHRKPKDRTHYEEMADLRDKIRELERQLREAQSA